MRKIYMTTFTFIFVVSNLYASVFPFGNECPKRKKMCAYHEDVIYNNSKGRKEARFVETKKIPKSLISDGPPEVEYSITTEEKEYGCKRVRKIPRGVYLTLKAVLESVIIRETNGQGQTAIRMKPNLTKTQEKWMFFYLKLMEGSHNFNCGK